MKLSIIIPARQEIYLGRTVDALLANAAGDVEVIIVLDGYWPKPDEMPKEDPRFVMIHCEKQGMRDSINRGVSASKGEYVMKIDAHCNVPPAYDTTLLQTIEDNWIVIPRRYSLDQETWGIRQFRPFVDYEYLGWPWRTKKRSRSIEFGLRGWPWDERIAQRINEQIDETMTWQGSCWLMGRSWWDKRIGRMDTAGYGTFVSEAQELGLKTWLGGGKVMVNKKTWYAHLWKGVPYRDAFKEREGKTYTRLGHTEAVDGNRFTVEYWMGNRWKDRKHDIEWLIERFWPVPSWPEDRSLWTHSPTS